MMKSNTTQSNMTILDMLGQLEKRLETAQKENQVLQKKIQKREHVILQQQRQIKRLKQEEVIDVASAILPLEMGEKNETASPTEEVPTIVNSDMLSFADAPSTESLQTDEFFSTEQVPSEAFQPESVEIPSTTESRFKTSLGLSKRYSQTKVLLGKVFGEISFTSPRRRNQFAHLSKQFS